MAARKKKPTRKAAAKTKKAKAGKKAKKGKPTRKAKKTSAPRRAKKAAGRLSGTLARFRRGLAASGSVAVTTAEWDGGDDPVTGYGWTGTCADRNNAGHYARADLTETERTDTSFCGEPGNFEVVLCTVA